MRIALLVLPAMLAWTACDEGAEGFDQQPVFHLTTGPGEGDARLKAAREYTWWWNTIANSEYESWSTEFDEDNWRPKSASAQVQLLQTPELYLAAHLQMENGQDFDFVNTQLGYGWRQVTPAVGDTRPLDLRGAGLAPSDPALEPYLDDCTVQDTRVLASLSMFPGTMDDLVIEATASAEQQGLPAPKDWVDVVHDEQMYEFLFGLHKTHTVDEATFAFVALQIDPLCGSLRLTFRTEADLVGPVAKD